MRTSGKSNLEGIELDKQYVDKVSAKDTNRPSLQSMLEFVRQDDLVIVHSMDRLARSLDNLRRIVKDLTSRGVQIQFVKESITFSGNDSAMSNLLLSVMGAFAEFARSLIKERRREGIALAKNRVIGENFSKIETSNGSSYFIGEYNLASELVTDVADYDI
jgi:DNA invertase Pin-like site-specific DNA recombinase